MLRSANIFPHGGSELIIEKLFINDEDYSDKILNLSISTIEKIDIETANISELKLHNINEVINYLTQLKNIMLQHLQSYQQL